jgi:hypothetical protein
MYAYSKFSNLIQLNLTIFPQEWAEDRWFFLSTTVITLSLSYHVLSSWTDALSHILSWSILSHASTECKFT